MPYTALQTNTYIIKCLLDRVASKASMAEMIYEVDFIASLPDTRYVHQRLIESFVYVPRTPKGRCTFQFNGLLYGHVVRIEEYNAEYYALLTLPSGGDPSSEWLFYSQIGTLWEVIERDANRFIDRTKMKLRAWCTGDSILQADNDAEPPLIRVRLSQRSQVLKWKHEERFRYSTIQPMDGTNGPTGIPFSQADPLVGQNVLITVQMARTDISVVEDNVCFLADREYDLHATYVEHFFQSEDVEAQDA